MGYKTLEIKDTCYKGTRIILGEGKRVLINSMIGILIREGFEEIQLPIIQHKEIFDKKIGDENQHMMFNFKDKGNRDLCLAPEYTAVIQKLASTYFKQKKNVKIFYVQECFRGEKPQAGRYRQFTQLGVEILNPSKKYLEEYKNLISNELISLALSLVKQQSSHTEFNVNPSAKRGLDYYKEGMGFEITCDELGAQKQICGGGEYLNGVGFAIGIDRLLLIKPK